MQAKEIIHKGNKIFYKTIGEGPIVVLLHGVPFYGSLWTNQFNAFPGYKLIIPDLPGSGRSEIIQDMSIEGMAECVKDIILYEILSGPSDSSSEKESKAAIVIGHSMGGYITLALAQKYPELLKGFGLFHSTAHADSDERKEGRKKLINRIREKGIEEFVKTFFPDLFGPVAKNDKVEMIDKEMANACSFSAETIVFYQTAMMKRPDKTEVLKKATIPVLFVLGKYDTVVALKDGLEQCSLADLNYIHILENSGHVGMMEEPVETNIFLLNYLTNTCRYTP